MTTTLPRFDLERLDGGALCAALAEHGAFRVAGGVLAPARCAAALAAAAAYFEQPAAAKLAMHVDRSAHFRGYSEMHNERDHREQLHLGRDEPAPGPEPAWRRLLGPNPWPGPGGVARDLEAFLGVTEAIGVAIAAAIAAARPQAAWPADGGAPYVLLKAICYHAQAAGAPPRRGVAAHVDFSWLTLTLADDCGGLELRAPDGAWSAPAVDADSLLVHPGELLHYVTGGALPATPHRVTNPSATRRRLSLPTFVLPNLGVELRAPVGARPVADPPDDHVHRVLVGAGPARLAVGAAEWRRKGRNRWCAVCCA